MRCVVAKNKVFFIVYTPVIHLLGVRALTSYTYYTPVRCTRASLSNAGVHKSGQLGKAQASAKKSESITYRQP